MIIERIQKHLVKNRSTKHLQYTTHDWLHRDELPICKKCGETPISLGIWGDKEWASKHKGWMKPCRGYK